MTDFSSAPVPGEDKWEYPVERVKYDEFGWAVQLALPDDEFAMLRSRRHRVGRDGQSWIAWRHDYDDRGHQTLLDFLTGEAKAVVYRRRSGSRGQYQFRKCQHDEIQYRGGTYVLAVVDSLVVGDKYRYGVVESREFSWQVIDEVVDWRWSYRPESGYFACDISWSRFFDVGEMSDRYTVYLTGPLWNYFT